MGSSLCRDHGVLGPQAATLARRLPRETWEYSSPPPGASTTDTRRREGGRQAELEVLQQNSFTLEWGEGEGGAGGEVRVRVRVGWVVCHLRVRVAPAGGRGGCWRLHTTPPSPSGWRSPRAGNCHPPPCTCRGAWCMLRQG